MAPDTFITNEPQDEHTRQLTVLVEQGRAEIAAGLGLDDEVAEAWLDSLDNDPDAPLPISSASRP